MGFSPREFLKDTLLILAAGSALMCGASAFSARAQLDSARDAAFQALNLLQTEIERQTPNSTVVQTIVTTPPGIPPSVSDSSKALPANVKDATDAWRRAVTAWSLLGDERGSYDVLNGELRLGFSKLGVNWEGNLADLLPDLVGAKIPVRAVAWGVGAGLAALAASFVDARGTRGRPT